MLPGLPRGSSADQARAIFAGAGWRTVGSGDWAWVLASPDDSLVARVTPFDPAFRLFAAASLRGPANPYLVRIDELLPLRHRGYVVVMERLHTTDEHRALRLAAALTIDPEGAWAPSANADPGLVTDPDVVDLRRRIGELVAAGERLFALWGGADVRPENILQTTDGQLRITDPVFIRGFDIFEAIRDGRADRLRDFSRADLQDFLSIPVFPPGPETDALRQKVDTLMTQLTGGTDGVAGVSSSLTPRSRLAWTSLTAPARAAGRAILRENSGELHDAILPRRQTLRRIR